MSAELVESILVDVRYAMRALRPFGEMTIGLGDGARKALEALRRVEAVAESAEVEAARLAPLSW